MIVLGLRKLINVKQKMILLNEATGDKLLSYSTSTQYLYSSSCTTYSTILVI